MALQGALVSFFLIDSVNFPLPLYAGLLSTKFSRAGLFLHTVAKRTRYPKETTLNYAGRLQKAQERSLLLDMVNNLQGSKIR